MRLGERFRQVVVSNFIEIARDEATEATETVKTVARAEAATAATVAYGNSADTAASAGLPERSLTPVTAALNKSTPPLMPSNATAPAPATPSPAPAEAPRKVPDVTEWFVGADPAMASEYAGILASDGTPDFEKLFQNADLSAVSCSADEAVKILADMPSDLPMRVRRITARATVDRLSQSNPTALHDIISDASQKMVRVARLSERTGERANLFRADIDKEIAVLEAKVAERRAALALLEERRLSVQKACRARIGELNDVVLFFDHPDVSGAAAPLAPPLEIASPNGTATADDNEEIIPPFLRDDAVRRMLGIREGDSGGVAAPSPDDETDSVSSSPRRGSGRRRVAAAAAGSAASDD